MSILFQTLARIEKENGEVTEGFADMWSLVEEGPAVDRKESQPTLEPLPTNAMPTVSMQAAPSVTPNLSVAPIPAVSRALNVTPAPSVTRIPAATPAPIVVPAPLTRASDPAPPSVKPARGLRIPVSAKSLRGARGVPRFESVSSWRDEAEVWRKAIRRARLTRSYPNLQPLAVFALAGMALFAVMPKMHARAFLEQVRQATLVRPGCCALNRPAPAPALDPDFRAGLDNWISRGNTAATSWSVDTAGFAHPGKLALYRPSLDLIDYRMQFVGTIDKKALSWVVRAADFDNYYVVKLSVLKPGPQPTIGVTRYAVINGKAQHRTMIPLVMNAQADTVYRVRLDVHADNFALTVQDQRVDTWSEPRLQRGGIGFFSEDKAKSSVIGLKVTGQPGMLGQLFSR